MVNVVAGGAANQMQPISRNPLSRVRSRRAISNRTRRGTPPERRGGAIAGLLLGVLLAAAPSAQAAIAFVQANAAVPQTAQTTVTIPYPATQTAGNLNVVVIGWNDSAVNLSSVTDTNGNVYQLAVGPTVIAGTSSQAIYYAANIAAAAAGANTVAVRFTGAARYADIRILESSGVATTSPLDGTASATGTNATSASGTVTTTASSALLVAANMVQTWTKAAGTGFVARLITNPDGDIAEDRIVTAAGSYSATAALGGAGPWIMQLVAFRDAGSGGTPDTTPPTAPGAVAATAASATRIDLSWGAATDNVGVTGYRVERCAGTGCATFAQVAAPAGTTYSDTGLTGGTTYRYRVRATDAAGNLGPYSAVGEATTPQPPDTQAPTAPGAVAATAASATRIDLSWGAATDNVGVTGYRVERCAGTGCATFAQVAAPAGTTYSDTGLTGLTTYRYRVRATDAAGNLGPYSAVGEATTPAPTDTQAPSAPGAVTATATGGTAIDVNWGRRPTTSA